MMQRRKRKRGVTFARMGRQMRARRLFAPQRGFARLGGFYGRYAGAGGRQRRYGRGETKFFDTPISFVNLNNLAGEVFQDSVNLIPQGVQEDERVGRKCNLVSMEMKLQYTAGADADEPYDDVIRIIIFLDKQANGAIATPQEILQDPTVFSFYNLENSSRFRILYDNTQSFNSLGATDADPINHIPKYSARNRYLRCYKRMNLPIEFGGTTGALTEVRSNNIGILGIRQAAGIVEQPVISGNGRVRVRFSDN